jgi:hypothetical protein
MGKKTKIVINPGLLIRWSRVRISPDPPVSKRLSREASAVITGQRDNLAAFLTRGERTVRHWQAGRASTTVLFDSTCFANFNQPRDLQKA